jgi:hypothetical protein
MPHTPAISRRAGFYTLWRTIMTSDALAQTIGKSIDLLQTIYAKYDEYKNITLKNEALLRAYYLEVVTNIDLIDSVLSNISNSTPITGESSQAFINSLQTTIAVRILFSEETQNCKAFKTLLSKSKLYSLEDEYQTV